MVWFGLVWSGLVWSGLVWFSCLFVWGFGFCCCCCLFVFVLPRPFQGMYVYVRVCACIHVHVCMSVYMCVFILMYICYSQIRNLVILSKCLKVQSFPRNSCFDRAFPGKPKSFRHSWRMTKNESLRFPDLPDCHFDHQSTFKYHSLFLALSQWYMFWFECICGDLNSVSKSRWLSFSFTTLQTFS